MMVNTECQCKKCHLVGQLNSSWNQDITMKYREHDWEHDAQEEKAWVPFWHWQRGRSAAKWEKGASPLLSPSLSPFFSSTSLWSLWPPSGDRWSLAPSASSQEVEERLLAAWRPGGRRFNRLHPHCFHHKLCQVVFFYHQPRQVVSGFSPGATRGLNIRTHLYVGGVDSQIVSLIMPQLNIGLWGPADVGDHSCDDDSCVDSR